MSDTYEGPVEIMHDKAATIDAHAVLDADTSGPLKEWGGRLYVDGAGSVFNLDMVTLRTPDGRTGKAIPVAAGDGFVEVRGSGAPPWDAE